MSDEHFLQAYNQLNKEQKEAVDTIEGPVMVVAGPGTGKTQILTLRIANILRLAQVNPSNILALTFTEAASINMRKRLSAIIGSSAYGVTISTFHGFCNDIIKEHSEYFPGIVDSDAITEVEQIQIIESILNTKNYTHLRPVGNPFFHIRNILNAIRDLKMEGISPSEFEDILNNEDTRFELIPDLLHEKGRAKGKMKSEYVKKKKELEKARELLSFYTEYQNILSEKKYYDFSDMIMEVLKALQTNEELLLILQEQYQYILVDEHQDTNNAQNKIMELLASFHENPNIFVVGDEKQAIYRFQGASLENFRYFQRLYPTAKLITLIENYRSSQSILDHAHTLMKKNYVQLLATKKYENKPIRICAFSKPEYERYFIAKDIQEILKEGVEASEIVVLYRENRDAFPIARWFEKMGILFHIESDIDILHDPLIRKVIILLKAIHEFGKSDALIEAMHIDFMNIKPLDVYKIMNNSLRLDTEVPDLIRDKPTLDLLGVEGTDAILDLYERFERWNSRAFNDDLPAFFELLLKESGLLEYVLKSDKPLENMAKINALFSEMNALFERKRDAKLKDFMQFIQTIEEHNVLIKKEVTTGLKDRVRLMTAHKSKGLEFEYVYIVNTIDRKWGAKKNKRGITLPASVYRLTVPAEQESTEENEDEKRLFYVALTRAKKEVTITYSTTSDENKEQIETQFINDLNPELVIREDTNACQKEFDVKPEILFTTPPVQKPDIQNVQFIKQIFLSRGISATALNHYLNCPWQFFYEDLLILPKSQEPHQMYGTAMHNSLKDFFEEYKTKDPGKEFLVHKFLSYLERLPLSKLDFAEYKERGKKSLDGYYDFYGGQWHRKVYLEFKLRGVMLTDEIRLTGKMDKLELSDNGKEVVVVDYKTGDPKSRGEIEGNTQNSKGDIKRQLVFYNLLLNKYESGKYSMTAGEIDFVEPMASGNYKREQFTILQEDVQALEQLILSVCDEIMNLKFWDKRCEDEACEYCALREVMK